MRSYVYSSANLCPATILTRISKYYKKQAAARGWKPGSQGFRSCGIWTSLLDQEGLSQWPFLCTWANLPSKNLPPKEAETLKSFRNNRQLQTRSPCRKSYPSQPRPSPSPGSRPSELHLRAQGPTPTPYLTLTPTHLSLPASPLLCPMPTGAATLGDPAAPRIRSPETTQPFSHPGPTLTSAEGAGLPSCCASQHTVYRTRSLPQGVWVRARSGLGRRKGRG